MCCISSEAARDSDLERLRIASPEHEVALRETDAAISHVKSGGDLALIMHPERLESIKKVFYSMDDDSSGTITTAEMLVFARAYKKNENFKEKRVQKLISKIDTDGDGTRSAAFHSLQIDQITC